jgi:hypothetical protein
MASRFAPYRDVLQPLGLAVYEIKLGLALAAAAADAAAVEPAPELPAALSSLLAFPSATSASSSLAGVAVSDTAVAALAAPMAARSAEQSSLDVGTMETDGQHAVPAGESLASLRAAEELRVQLLRVALVSCGDAALRSGFTSAASWSVLRSLFSRAADIWAAARAEIAEAEAEAVTEFRCATRSLAAAAAEAAAADEEASYRARFELSPFEDFEAQPDDQQLSTAEMALAASVVSAAAAKAHSAAAASQPVFGAALLEDLLFAHRAATSSGLSESADSAAVADATADTAAWHAGSVRPAFASHGTPVWAAALCSTQETFSALEVQRCARAAASHALGARLLRDCGGARGDVLLDGDALGGSALRICLEHIRLARGISSGALPHAPPAHASVRLCRECSLQLHAR